MSDAGIEAVAKQMLLDDCEGSEAAAERLWKGEDRELYMEGAPRVIQAFLTAEGFEVEPQIVWDSTKGPAIERRESRLVSLWRPT